MRLSLPALLVLVATACSSSSPRPQTRGRVVDETGAPVAGAQIGFDLIPLTATDADGRFAIRFDPAIHFFAVRAPGRGGMIYEVAHAPAEIVLAPEARMTGHVVDATGAPIGGATVRAVGVVVVHDHGHGDGHRVGASDAAITDATGGFTLDQLSAGDAVMEVVTPGLALPREPWTKIPVVAGQVTRDVVLAVALTD